MKNLISIPEVIDLAPAGHSFDAKLLEPFVKDVDIDLQCDECFGDLFYQTLINDIVSFEEFDNCKSYITDEVVVYGAQFYKALNDPAAGTLPTDAACWEVTNKFNTQKYQDLYDNCLREYLVFGVLQYAIPSIAYQANTAGIMRNNTDYSESADDKGVFNLKHDWQNKREKRFKAMHNFLTRKIEELSIDNTIIYTLYPPNKESRDCKDDCKPEDDSINMPFL